MSMDLVKVVLENVCLLLTTHTREIVGSALSFIRMFLTSFPYDTVAPEVTFIVSILKFVGNDNGLGKCVACDVLIPNEQVLKYHL